VSPGPCNDLIPESSRDLAGRPCEARPHDVSRHRRRRARRLWVHQHPAPRTFGGDRPVNLQIPSTLEAGKLYPLVLILHGFGANGFVQEAYFGMSSLAADDTAFVLAPDGTTNSMGQRSIFVVGRRGVACYR
jgi:poly(3-hydroxybutyrate) depolymerase